MKVAQIDGGCIACRGALDRFGARRGYTYAICRDCGTIQLAPIPTAEQLARAYREDYAKAGHIAADPQRGRDATRPLHASLVAALRRHGAGQRILDYGAGWGGLTIQLRAAGFDVIGYDLSDEMAAYSRREGLPIRVGGIGDVVERDFDAIVLASVFEHLNDPVSWLRRAHELLRPGGLLVTTQPTAPFAHFVGNLFRLGIRKLPLPGLHQVFCPPWHIALYSLDGMRRVVEREGFDCMEITPAPQQREPGLTGLVQVTLEAVNRMGWALMKLKWPFYTGHNFVFRRR